MMSKLHVLAFTAALALGATTGAWAGGEGCTMSKDASAKAGSCTKGAEMAKGGGASAASGTDVKGACTMSKDMAKGDCASKCEAAAGGGASAASGTDAKGACTSKDMAKGDCASKCEAAAGGGASAASGADAKGACTMSKDMAKGDCASKCEAAAGGGESAASGAGAEDGKAYKVGNKVADFSLENSTTGEKTSLSSIAGEKGTVLIFWNQTCPYVVEVQDRVDEFSKTYSSKGVKVVAIDAGVSNSKTAIKEHASKKSFPVLINDTSEIAAKFGATRTPEVFLLDKDMTIQYHGAFDSGQMKNKEGNRDSYAQNAVEELLKNGSCSVTTTRAFGCSLKYKDGVKPLS